VCVERREQNVWLKYETQVRERCDGDRETERERREAVKNEGARKAKRM
jgi:hypothetical protein